MESVGWLIEMQGPCWLAARHLGGYEFYWSRDDGQALRFINQEQADLVMMTVRQTRLWRETWLIPIVDRLLGEKRT